jgi:mutator protein MutT
VLFRVFVAKGDPKAHAMRRHLWELSEALVPYKHVFDFNQGLMDLGATVCAPRTPRCDGCPMKRFCRTSPHRRKSEESLTATTLHVVAARGRTRRLLSRDAPAGGVHLAGLWEFPGGKVAPGESHEAALRREMQEELDTDVAVHSVVSSAAHAYDDRHVTLHFYRCELAGSPRPLLGQENALGAARGVGDPRFPPADEELIALLTAGVEQRSSDRPIGTQRLNRHRRRHAARRGFQRRDAHPRRPRSRCT